MYKKIRICLQEARAIYEDGKGDWKFYYIFLTFFGGAINIGTHDLLAYACVCLNFALSAYYGVGFWKRTENNRRVRRWKRDHQ